MVGVGAGLKVGTQNKEPPALRTSPRKGTFGPGQPETDRRAGTLLPLTSWATWAYLSDQEPEIGPKRH